MLEDYTRILVYKTMCKSTKITSKMFLTLIERVPHYHWSKPFELWCKSHRHRIDSQSFYREAWIALRRDHNPLSSRIIFK